MHGAIGHNSAGRVRCIFRSHGDRGYTKLKNSFLQDKRITDETRGLVARLLSLPEDWEVTVRSIIASGKAGRDKVYRMLNEAEKYGYIKPDQAHRADGKFDRQIYFVSDDPEALIRATAQEILAMEETSPADGEPIGDALPADDLEEDDQARPDQDLPLTEKPEAAYQQAASGKAVSGKPGSVPLPAKPDTAEPFTANPQGTKEYREENNIPPVVPPGGDTSAQCGNEPAKRKRSAIPDEYPDDFEAFWKVYPRREGKANAYRVWERLTLPQKRRAYAALKSQLPALTARLHDIRGNFCPLPATWIGQGRFDDCPADAPPPAEMKPPNMPEHVWRKVQADRAKAQAAR